MSLENASCFVDVKWLRWFVKGKKSLRRKRVGGFIHQSDNFWPILFGSGKEEGEKGMGVVQVGLSSCTPILSACDLKEKEFALVSLVWGFIHQTDDLAHGR